MRFLRNADERLRLLEREGDPVRVLIERVRRGLLLRGQLEWAARLGREDAAAACSLLGCGPIGLVDWSVRSEREWAIRGIFGRNRRRTVAFAVDVAEHVLPLFERNHPDDDDRPQRALALARAWSQGRRVSRASLEEAASAARASTRVAWASTRVASASSAWAAAWAAAGAAAAGAAAWVAGTAAGAAAAGAASAEAWAAALALVEAERDWQRLRLAQYALGEA